MLPIMPSLAASIDYEEKLSTLLARYERMERATPRETDWIELEAAVNQAFIDAEQVFLDAVARQAADSDDARRTQEHMNALASLRKRIEGQFALAEAREKGQGVEMSSPEAADPRRRADVPAALEPAASRNRPTRRP